MSYQNVDTSLSYSLANDADAEKDYWLEHEDEETSVMSALQHVSSDVKVSTVRCVDRYGLKFPLEPQYRCDAVTARALYERVS